MLIRILLAAITLITLSSIATAADWPEIMGPKRRGTSQETGWNLDWANKEPRVMWKVSLGPGVSSCAVVAGFVYTMGSNGDAESVICLDAETGNQVWRQNYDCEFDKRSFETGGPAATPVVDGDRVYTLSFRGQLFCWSTSDGKKLWELNMEREFKGVAPRWGWAGSPLVAGNMLIIEPGGNGSSRAAVDKLTGKVFWQSGTDPVSYASPIIFSGPEMRGVALFNVTGLIGINPRDGTELFRQPWKTTWDVNAAIPLHRDGKFFIGSGYGSGVALVDAKSGPVWTNKSLMLHFQSPVLHDDQIYFISGDNNNPGKLHCLDWATGKVNWSQPVGGQRGNVIVAGDKLIAVAESGEVILADASPAAFDELGRFQALPKTVWAAPAFSEKRLFVRNNTGSLVCLDLQP